MDWGFIPAARKARASWRFVGVDEDEEEGDPGLVDEMLFSDEESDGDVDGEEEGEGAGTAELDVAVEVDGDWDGRADVDAIPGTTPVQPGYKLPRPALFNTDGLVGTLG